MRPLSFVLAREMKEEWKMRPYLGVLPKFKLKKSNLVWSSGVLPGLRYHPRRKSIQHSKSPVQFLHGAVLRLPTSASAAFR